MTFHKRKDYGARVRVWDNGGKTFDRYTILPPANAGAQYREHGNAWTAIGASRNPFHPQGFGQHVTAMPGPHLGKRIAWDALPIDVCIFARRVFPEFCPGVMP